MQIRKSYPTRERIMDVAINLFALYGFKEVSMRQIAADVEIKASSLYKHYKSKEDILERIHVAFEEKLRQTEIDIPDFSSPMEYFSQAYELFKNIMFEESVQKMAKIVIRDQIHSKSAKQFMIDEMIVNPVKATKHVLDMMNDNGLIRISDTQVYAEEYCAYIVYLYFNQNILNTEPDHKWIDKKMKQHNEFIVRCILNEGENK